MTVKMTEVPPADRPRERLLELGPGSLSDAELIALQLGSGRPGASALDVARHLLAAWGGLAGIASAHPLELARVPGVGRTKAARLVSSCALAGRLLRPRDATVISCSSDIAEVAMARLGRARTEHVAVIIADGGSRLTGVEIVAVGSAKSCPMPVREVLAAVLRHDGVAFGVAHNHPGGDATPTHADMCATDALRVGAEATGLRFLDHVVVTAADWRSVTMSREPSAR